MDRAKHVEARRIVDDGGAFAELKVGRTRLQLTPREAEDVRAALKGLFTVQEVARPGAEGGKR